MNTRRGKGAAVVVFGLLVAGCGTSAVSANPASTSVPATTSGSATTAGPATTAGSVTTAGAAAAAGPATTARPVATAVPVTTASPAVRVTPGLSLIVEPDQGIAPIDALLAQPRHSLDMVMYELVDPGAEQILAGDAARGVRVRVLLDERLEGRANTPAYQYLNAHGVQAVWAPESYPATHEKAMVIDAGAPGAVAVIMTLNLTARYYAGTRDFAVSDTDPADIAAIESAFQANLAGQAPKTAPPGDDLVWSPGSADALVSVVQSARSTLTVENEEMSSPIIVAALEAAARRGVHVQVTMTNESEWTKEFDALVAAGVQVRTYRDSSSVLYIHAKAVVADGRQAFVGSENFSAASLDRNRELGLVTTNDAVVAPLATALSADWTAAAPWSG